MKKYSFFILFTLIFFFFSFPVFAYETEAIIKTTVGSPKAFLTTSGILRSAIDWDTQIVQALQPGLWGYINKLVSGISNGSYSTGSWNGTNEATVYWCTYSIIDSYNLAGVGGLSKASHAAVVNMRNYWKNAPAGYKYIDYPGSSKELASLQPGYAMFMELVPGQYTGNEHVAMIKSVSVDARGNGSIQTQDSNSSVPIHTYPVDNWTIQGTNYPVRGFGGVE